MSKRGRDIGATLLRFVWRLAPALISIGLVAWLIWTVTPAKLLAAFSVANWPALVAATLGQLVVLFVWDTLCLWWLFSQPDQRLPFRLVLRARTDTIVWSAINLEIGQAAFAWKLARARHEPVIHALGRCALLALFDFGTLTSLALAVSFLRPTPLIGYLRWICVVCVVGLLVLVVLVRFIPQRWRAWLESKQWANWLAWWNWQRSVVLWFLRLIMFLIVIVYAGVGLAICHVTTDVATVVTVIPFVMLAEALPGTGGLGEREAALIYLLNTPEEQRAVLLSFGLIWSTVIILGRVAIGMVSMFLPARVYAEDSSWHSKLLTSGTPVPSSEKGDAEHAVPRR